MWPNPQETADFVTCPEEILNGKFQLFAVIYIALELWQTEYTEKLSYFHCLQYFLTELINIKKPSHNLVKWFYKKMIWVTF